MRKLTLQKETFSELTTAELTSVVGAAPPSYKDCGSEIDACPTARGCTLSSLVC